MEQQQKLPIEKNEENTDSKSFESVNIKTEIKEEVKIKEENQNFDSDYKFDQISKESLVKKNENLVNENCKIQENLKICKNPKSFMEAEKKCKFCHKSFNRIEDLHEHYVAVNYCGWARFCM